MRRIYELVLEDHFSRNRQAAFVCGPRQVGKTTLAHLYANAQPFSRYFNWDRLEDRAKLLSSSYGPVIEALPRTPALKPLIIFDEIHKHKDWKIYLKGFIDTHAQDFQILVTGSAKLNVFRKQGDSLMGRYFLYRIHPLTIGELRKRNPLDLLVSPQITADEEIENLMHYGGFPEPFVKADQRFFEQWQQLRHQQLIFEDIQNIEKIHQMAQFEVLAYLLRHQVGQLLNYNTLASKVRVSNPTIHRWMDALRNFYYCFTLSPWSQNLPRSLLKEPKPYLWDWSLVEERGARLENFVASHLLKAVHYWTDMGLGQFELFFIRTKDQKEVDFILTRDRKPWILIEVKSSSRQPLSKPLIDFQKKLDVPYAFQLVFDLPPTAAAHDWLEKNLLEKHAPQPACILPAVSFLSMLV